VIKDLSNNKACGSDGIPAEIYKYILTEKLQNIMLQIINMSLNEGRIIDNLKDTIMILLHKKGSEQDCTNYRTISLLQVITKIFTKMISNRIAEHCEKASIPSEVLILSDGISLFDCHEILHSKGTGDSLKSIYHPDINRIIVNSKGQQLKKAKAVNVLPDSQAGFRKGRDRCDAIFSLQQLLCDCYISNVPVFVIFIDLVKAYDYVPREIMWRVLKNAGIPEKILKLIIELHNGSTARIRVDGKLSRPIMSNCGLKQGCGGAPLLFIIFFSAILWVIDVKLKNKGIKYRIQCKGQLSSGWSEVILIIRELLYADDAAFVATSQIEAQQMMDIINQVMTDFGMKISFQKTEVLLQQPRLGDKLPNPNIMLDGKTIKVVSDFKYLGVIFEDNNSQEKDINRRIAIAAAAFGKIKFSLLNEKVPLGDRLQLYTSFVLTCLLQCAAVRKFSSLEVKKLESFHYRKLRAMCGWTKLELKSQREVILKTGIPFIETLIARDRILIAGKYAKLPTYRTVNLLSLDNKKRKLKDNIAFKKNTNHLTWFTCLEKDLKNFNMSRNALMLDKSEFESLIVKGIVVDSNRLLKKKQLVSDKKYKNVEQRIMQHEAARTILLKENKKPVIDARIGAKQNEMLSVTKKLRVTKKLITKGKKKEKEKRKQDTNININMQKPAINTVIDNGSVSFRGRIRRQKVWVSM
jgi:hypothetical protein